MTANRFWKAHEALSWGIYGDETQPILSPNGLNPSLQPIRPYNEARRELSDSIARRTITAHGFRKSRNKPPLAREMLPPDLFEQFPKLAVDAVGETSFMHPSSPEDIPQWTGIVFEADEVRALWPKPTPNIDTWLLNDVQSRPNEKRDSRLADCRKATGCTFRQAAAAFRRLPPDLKRGRGKRI